jgi:hypothetical protein
MLRGRCWREAAIHISKSYLKYACSRLLPSIYSCPENEAAIDRFERG